MSLCVRLNEFLAFQRNLKLFENTGSGDATATELLRNTSLLIIPKLRNG